MPTIKQKQAFDKIVENRGMGVSTAMVKVGYKKKTAKNPKNLTESKGWEELMDIYLPEEELAKAHKEMLNAGFIERIGFEKDIEDEYILEVFKKAKGCKVLYIRHYKDSDKTAYIQVIDNNARKNALEMAYKLKGSYAPEKSINLNIEISQEEKAKIDKALEDI